MSRTPDGAGVVLAAGDYRLHLDPAGGGAVTGFEWQGAALFHPRRGPGILEQACFPLVPFSNRIAFGRFSFEGEAIALAPNFPGSDHPHTLHGFGWQAPWRIAEQDGAACRLIHDHDAGAWPWSYRAEQQLTLSPGGLTHVLRIQNRADRAMPAGLGLHPYFPRTPRTLLRARHRGEWQTGDDGLPLSLTRAARDVDWWQGAPVGSRSVDTVYEERSGPIEIVWPDRGITLAIAPSSALRHTVIYCPADADFFCVEPVTHATDALNRMPLTGDVVRLAPGRWLEVGVTYRAMPSPADPGC
ncbi:aldose 1-epimerase [Sphingomonas sp.]|uniref:aldose 1-epimerase n=1 Tax=Sphingomonas sp. TaxID=28214 RepID=UPI0035C843D3